MAQKDQSIINEKNTFPSEIQKRIAYYKNELIELDKTISDKKIEYQSAKSEVQKDNLKKKVKLLLKKKNIIEQQISYFNSDFFKYQPSLRKSCGSIPSFIYDNSSKIGENLEQSTSEKNMHIKQSEYKFKNKIKIILGIITLLVITASLIYRFHICKNDETLFIIKK